MSEPDQPPPKPPSREDLAQEVIHLHEAGYGTRRIRDRLHLSRDRVRKILEQAGHLERAPKASKLAPFAQAIAERVDKRLTTSRILLRCSREWTRLCSRERTRVHAEHLS
jgi:hypothetical protein